MNHAQMLFVMVRNYLLLLYQCSIKRYHIKIISECQNKENDTAKNDLNLCGKTMSCDHICSSLRAECSSMKFMHLPCKQNCERKLICGHACPLSCGELCQPCAKQKCLFQCHHKVTLKFIIDLNSLSLFIPILEMQSYLWR